MDIYENNEDFRQYVDKYASKHKITVNEALTHKIIWIYWDMIKPDKGR